MAERRRLKACVERWPEARDGDYDPRCCRFPKSCSCLPHPDHDVPDEMLEVEPCATCGCDCDFCENGHHTGHAGHSRRCANVRRWRVR